MSNACIIGGIIVFYTPEYLGNRAAYVIVETARRYNTHIMVTSVDCDVAEYVVTRLLDNGAATATIEIPPGPDEFGNHMILTVDWTEVPNKIPL